MKIVIQINGTYQCPIWTKFAADNNLETIWYQCTPHQTGININNTNPDLMIVQCAVRWFDFQDLGWDKLTCPIIASCGDALPLTNHEMVFNNLTYVTRLYVEGIDYINKYAEWCNHNGISPQLHKLRYQQLCADNHFQPLPPEPKLYDWCFLGQAYPIYEERLKHYRRQLIPQLLKIYPNGYVSGPGWHEIIISRGDWIDQSLLNSVYNKSKAIVSIDAHDGPGYTSTRTIEAMFAGHCVLIYDHPGMWYLKKFINHSQHALYFKDPSEFTTCMEFVKHNPEIAATIGQAGRHRVIELGWTVSAWMKDCLTLLK